MKNYKKLKPFKLCVLENFPFIAEDFDSLTNYELLCKVVEYLNKVINNVNELDEFIKNLDLQDEVNNKLDNMAEDGTLSELIALYVNKTMIRTYNTISNMKEAILEEDMIVKTLGYHTLNDNGGSLYKIRLKTEQDEIDEGKIIELNDNLVAELIIFNSVNVEQFGAYGDGENDDTISINNALKAFNAVNFNEKQYLISSGIIVNSSNVINGNNAKLLKTTNNAFINANNSKNIIIKDLNIIQTEDVYSYLFLGKNMENVKIENLYLENTVSTPGDDAPGMWAMYISGNKITINNIKINNYDCGLHADGIHIGDVNDLIIDGFNIKSGDDCIALNTPSDGNDVVSNNIIITNGIASSKRANIFRIDLADNRIFSNACYKNVEISNVICEMKEDNVANLLRFGDVRPSNLSTAKHTNINIKDIYMRGYARNWILPMISSSKDNFNHYGKIILDNIHADSYSHQIPAIELECDELIVKNCEFSACKDGSPLTSKARNFLLVGNTSLDIIGNKFSSILDTDKSIASITSQKTLVEDNTFIDNGTNNGYALTLSNVNEITLINNIAHRVNKFINYTTNTVIPNKYYFISNIYNNIGTYISVLESATKVKIIDGNNLRQYSGSLTVDSNNILKPDAGTIIHLNQNGLVVALRRAATGEVFHAWYDTSVNGFRPINYTVSQGQTYYVQCFI